MEKIGPREGRFTLKREEMVERRLLRAAVASGPGSGSGAISIVKIVCNRRGRYAFSCSGSGGKKKR